VLESFSLKKLQRLTITADEKCQVPMEGTQAWDGYFYV